MNALDTEADAERPTNKGEQRSPNAVQHLLSPPSRLITQPMNILIISRTSCRFATRTGGGEKL